MTIVGIIIGINISKQKCISYNYLVISSYLLLAYIMQFVYFLSHQYISVEIVTQFLILIN
jgi:hypothetical protein